MRTGLELVGSRCVLEGVLIVSKKMEMDGFWCNAVLRPWRFVVWRGVIPWTCVLEVLRLKAA